MDELELGEMLSEDNQQPEDVRSYSSNSVNEHVDHVDFEPEMIVCNQSAVTSAVTKEKLKRKIVEHSAQNGTMSQPVKLIKVEVNQTKPKNGVETAQRQHIKGE